MRYKMEGLHKLYTGDFNVMYCEVLQDGTRVITLSKYGEDKVYRFKILNMYDTNEQLLEHEVITVETPEYVKERIERFIEKSHKMDKEV